VGVASSPREVMTMVRAWLEAFPGTEDSETETEP
jgi:hypothetical protein